MNIKRIFGVMVLMALSLCATEVKVDGSYSKLLGNPFKAKLDSKSQDITITSKESKTISLIVKTNRVSDYSFRNPEITVLNTSCNNVLKNYLSEDYNIVKDSLKEVKCEILPTSVVNIEYAFNNDTHLNVVSDVVVDLVVKLTLKENDKTLIDKEIKTTMNKDLNRDGKLNYGLTIRAVFKPDLKNLEQTIQNIIENEIYSILLNNLR